MIRTILFAFAVSSGLFAQSGLGAEVQFGGYDWVDNLNHGRVLIGTTGDNGWTTFDNGGTAPSSQQWVWMDVATLLSTIPSHYEVTSAQLSFPGVRFASGGNTSVEFGIFEVVGSDRGRAAIINGTRQGTDVTDYYALNTNYGTVSGVTSTFTPKTFTVTSLLQGWEDGSLTINPGEMNILWDSEVGNTWARWGNTESDNANVAVANRPTLTVQTIQIAAQPDSVTLGNNPASVATTNNDSSAKAAFIDLSNATILSADASSYKITSWDFQITAANATADVVPFLAKRNSTGEFEVIWSGTELDSSIVGTVGSYSVDEGSLLTLTEDTVVYAGFWSSIAAGPQPIGFLNGSGLSWLNFGQIAAVTSPVEGTIYNSSFGSVAGFARTYDFQINLVTIPEPMSWTLAIIGGLAIVGLLKCRRK